MFLGIEQHSFKIALYFQFSSLKFFPSIPKLQQLARNQARILPQFISEGDEC